MYYLPIYLSIHPSIQHNSEIVKMKMNNFEDVKIKYLKTRNEINFGMLALEITVSGAGWKLVYLF